MALYLGKTGRKILNFVVSHPRLDKTVDVFSNAAIVISSILVSDIRSSIIDE